MSILDRISQTAHKPVVMTILGEPGVGKTSLAAAFPSPVFIKAEDGTEGVPQELKSSISELPTVSDVDQLWRDLHELVSEDHGFKTVVIDSVTALERIFQQHVVDSDPKKPKSINTAMGGYGAGFQAVGAMHQRVRKAASLLQDRGIHVLFLAHVEISTLDLPDQDPYSRYSLRLNKRSMAPYVDDVSAVGLVRLETFTMGDADDKRKKAVGSGNRIITMHATPASVTKNRYGITDNVEFAMASNPLIPYIPSLQE